MHDCNDWPVSFLGAMYAGIVPVAVNTLLTVDDYAYMLAPQPGAGGAGLGGLAADAAGRAGPGHARGPHGHRLGRAHRGARDGARGAGRAHRRPRADGRARRHRPRRRRLLALLLRLHRRAQGHGAHAGQPVLDGRALRRRACSACSEERRLLLGRQAVLRLRPGQRAELPAERGRHDRADGRAAHTRGDASSAGSSTSPTVFFGAPTGYAGMLASPRPARARRRSRCACARPPARRCPRDIGERFTAHFGCDIIDGIGSTEMLHIFLSNHPGQVRYGTTGWPVPGYEVELRGEDGRLRAGRRDRRPLHRRARAPP